MKANNKLTLVTLSYYAAGGAIGMNLGNLLSKFNIYIQITLYILFFIFITIEVIFIDDIRNILKEKDTKFDK